MHCKLSNVPIMRENDRLSVTARLKVNALKRIWSTVLRVKAILVTNTTTNMYMQNILHTNATISEILATSLFYER